MVQFNSQGIIRTIDESGQHHEVSMSGYGTSWEVNEDGSVKFIDEHVCSLCYD